MMNDEWCALFKIYFSVNSFPGKWYHFQVCKRYLKSRLLINVEKGQIIWNITFKS